MKAMILAAGLGTRLRPLTDATPKALIPVAGKPLLAHVIARLIHHGINQIIINLYHHADQIVKYVENEGNFGIDIRFSRESELLDTGGGLTNAAWFFDDNEPFLVHNVDVITDLDPEEMRQFHIQKNAGVTVAVRQRNTDRYLLFDERDRLVGRTSAKENKTEYAVDGLKAASKLSFMGIHIISPQVLPDFPAERIFPILTGYLALVKNNIPVMAYRADSFYWIDVGRKENIRTAEDYLRRAGI